MQIEGLYVAGDGQAYDYIVSVNQELGATLIEGVIRHAGSTVAIVSTVAPEQWQPIATDGADAITPWIEQYVEERIVGNRDRSRGW
ncbi:MAG: hypothetical protein KIT73_04605 [Burkholderiales bacterium]|nr:hypothetical protein [Burkholderiales bacterium]